MSFIFFNLRFFFQIRFYTHRYTATSIVKSPQDGRVAEGPSNRTHAVHPQSSFHRVIATLWFSIGAAVSIICLFGITIYLMQMLLAGRHLYNFFSLDSLLFQRSVLN